MKKALILTAIGLLCFVGGTVGIYLAMPKLSPDRVDSTRVRLDSLGLLGRADSGMVASALPDSLQADSSLTDSSSVEQALPTPQEMIQRLQDSLNVTNNLVQNLQADTTMLQGRIDELLAQVDELTTKDLDATELSKSLAKLDAKQLGSILAGLELDTIRLLYDKASAREKTQLLESMTAEQAARFIRTLVQGPLPDPAPQDDAPDATPVNAADGTTQNE